MEPLQPPYYTRQDLCEWLRTSLSAIKRYEKKGLRRTNLGPRLVRYSHADVEDFLRRREGPGDEEKPPTSNG
jgi:hypothetical protein